MRCKKCRRARECCRACRNAYNRAWYAKNASRRKKMVARNVKALRERIKAAVDQIKSAPCTDCGVKYPPYVMDFDHCRGQKDSEISDLIRNGYSLKRVLAEIEKCDLVCANCHRERTYGCVAQRSVQLLDKRQT